MEDQQIVDLYWQRNEKALSQTQKKYGKYCHSIAFAILYSSEDAEECVNDTLLRAWSAIPPARPGRLSTFLGKITRNLAIDRLDKNTAKKRSGQIEIVLDELSECIPDADSTPDLTDKIAMGDAINSFLASLDKETRVMFMQRYWYASPIKSIARELEKSESYVKVTLMRTRNKFKEHLEKEGIVV
jgi:RNA polymerase sigma-70 factor (ECF subfamily)